MATQLTTLASVKAFLAITGSGSDAMLTSLIEGCSSQVENFCERTLGETSHTQWLDGNGDRRMLLRDWPLTAVSLVKVDGVAVSQAADVSSPGYRFFDVGEVVMNPGGLRFTRGIRNCCISYTAGYASGAIPDDLEMVVNRMVGAVYKMKDWLGVSSKSLAGETVTYFKDEIEKPSNKAIIQNYKRVTP